MSGDTLHSLEVLSRRLRTVENTSTKLATLRDRVASELAGKQAEVVYLDSEIEIVTKVVELFRVLMDQLVEKQVKSIEKIGTEGLQTIFADLNLSLESEVAPKHNKIAVDFFIRRGVKGSVRSHRGRPLEAFGGGPSSVVSLILRILAIKRMKLWPLLVLDESLNAVSNEYVEATSQFLKSLADKLGFDILLVTHKPPFLDHADISYRCVESTEADGVSTYLTLRKST